MLFDPGRVSFTRSRAFSRTCGRSYSNVLSLLEAKICIAPLFKNNLVRDDALRKRSIFLIARLLAIRKFVGL